MVLGVPLGKSLRNTDFCGWQPTGGLGNSVMNFFSFRRGSILIPQVNIYWIIAYWLKGKEWSLSKCSTKSVISPWFKGLCFILAVNLGGISIVSVMWKYMFWDSSVLNSQQVLFNSEIYFYTVYFIHWFFFTLQHCAVASLHPKRKQVTELLLRKGANVNEKNKE